MEKNKKLSRTRLEMEGKKKMAYNYFTQHGFDQKVIAGIIHVTEATISKWKNEDLKKGKDWESDRDEIRTGFSSERKRIKQMLNRQMDIIEARPHPDNVANSKEGDAISKLSKSAKALNNELTFDHRSKSYDILAQYVQATYGQEAALKVIEWAHECQMNSL